MNYLYAPEPGRVVHLDAGAVYELAEELARKLISEGLAVSEPKKKSTKES